MKSRIGFLIWLATLVAMSAATVDQKTSHGPLSLGQMIETLDKTKLKQEDSRFQATKEGKEIEIKRYRFNVSELVFGNLPVTEAHVDTVAGSIMSIYLLLDKEVEFESNQDVWRENLKKNAEKKKLLLQALIEKYGSSVPKTEYSWKGDDVTLYYSLEATPTFNDTRALVILNSQRSWDMAIAAYFESQKSKTAEDKVKAQKLKDNL